MPRAAVRTGSRESEEVPAAPSPDLRARVLAAGAAAGLAAVGVAPAEVLHDARADLEDRRRRGLHGGMQFTFRNPDRSTDPDQVLRGARSLVVGALVYRRDDDRDVAEGAGPGGPGRPRGRVARFARRDHYGDLRAALGQVAAELVADGWQARTVVDDNALVDRAAARRAGLGWFGRNSLLLVPGVGSWCVLGSVVTDAPLEATDPLGPTGHAEGCGPCTRCMDACPTGALVAPGVLDARRCLAWVVQAPGAIPVELRAAMGDRIYGCDDCQEVCPVNRLADRHRPPGRPEAGSVAAVDLLWLLEATDDEVLAAAGRWYVAERDPRYLRRNALVALGNVGDPGDPTTAAALARWSAADDALLAEHARWAADRLGRTGTARP